MWIPDTVNKKNLDLKIFFYSCLIFLKKGNLPDLLATSGDYLRVWLTSDTGTRLECLLNNVIIIHFFAFFFVNHSKC